jgi:AcrR family transcriptional regulator
MTPDNSAAVENADFVGSRSSARASKTSPAGLDALRDVARREFVARGYHAVSIRDIAKESGSSLSVLYHYYASKQELLYSVLNEAIDSFHATLESHAPDLEKNADPVQRFAAVIESLVVYRATRKLDSLLFIRELRNLEPKYAQLISSRRADVRELLDTVITDGVAAGVFKTPFPADARRAIVAMLNAIAEWYRQPGELTIEMLVARYTRLALAVVEYAGDLNTTAKASDSMWAQTTD